MSPPCAVQCKTEQWSSVLCASHQSVLGPRPSRPAQLSPTASNCTVTVSTRGWVSNYGCPRTRELHNYNLTLLHNQGSLTPARHFSTHGNSISTSLRIILNNRARMLEGNYFAATQWRSLKAGLECLVFTWPGFHRFLTDLTGHTQEIPAGLPAPTGPPAHSTSIVAEIIYLTGIKICSLSV